MSSKAKNILIAFLLMVIVCLLWMLFTMSYGRYCKPIIREPKYPGRMAIIGNTGKLNFQT